MTIPSTRLRKAENTGRDRGVRGGWGGGDEGGLGGGGGGGDGVVEGGGGGRRWLFWERSSREGLCVSAIKRDKRRKPRREAEWFPAY